MTPLTAAAAAGSEPLPGCGLRGAWRVIFAG